MDEVRISLAKKLPFCVYRKPSEKQVNGIFQGNDVLHDTSTFKESGFVIAPFNFRDKAYLILSDKCMTADVEPEVPDLRNQVPEIDSGKEFHLELIQKGIHAIEHGMLKKVVLSRKIDIPLAKDPLELFGTLLGKYPNAMCYLFFHPQLGMWCGATPETLAHIKGNELLTMSLAATATKENTIAPKWGRKEIEEQHMVTNHIEQKLQPILEEVSISAAQSVIAGTLWHLQSKITGKLLPETSTKDIIKALHPTPAVCGVPTLKAKKFIEENENYQRSFYTGFLGELNLENDMESTLFVNLRCMELFQGKAIIFVGGGITGSSDPEAEWSETQHKSKTMLGITLNV